MAKEPSQRSSFSRAGISLGVFVQTACVLFLIGAVNYVGFNYYKRWDFSRSQRFTLADQTEQALRQLDSPLKITVYFSSSSLGPDAMLYGDVQNLLAQFAFSARRKIEVRQVDPARDASTARQLPEKYKFDGNQNVVILDYEGHSKVIPVIDLGDFDLSGVQLGEAPKLSEFKGEVVLTSAIIELLYPRKEKVYFVQGHGEILPSRLLLLGEAIARQNAASLGINLGLIEQVPADAGVLCIFGPRYDFPAAEIKLLERYWAANGRIVVLLDPTASLPAGLPNLRKFLNDAGIFPRNDRVQVIAPSLTQPGLFTIVEKVLGVFLPDNPITKRLVGVNALLPPVTQSLLLDDAVASKTDVQLRPLIQAAEKYWGEADYADRKTVGLRYDDGKDVGEPVIVAASAEKGASRDERTDVASARLVVTGNCTFIDDEALREAPANLDFMISVLNRMLERSKLAGIAPKSTAGFALSLTETQIRNIAFYALIVIPGAAALFGLIVAFRRRA